MKHLIYLHGFASSANGRKAQYLRPLLGALPAVAFHAVEFSPTPADFEYLTITGMINRLRQYILDHKLDSVSLIGSSMGGLVALNYAHRFHGVTRLLLLSPALTYISGDRVRVDGQEICTARIVSETEMENGRLSLALRPELLSLNGHAPAENQLIGRVETIAFLGSIVRIRVRLQETTLLLDEFNNPHLTVPAIEDTVVLSFQREACLVLQP
jgi:pimeloyl-ACP methyl ester carboxylesterase